jgi:hypothetical protein
MEQTEALENAVKNSTDNNVPGFLGQGSPFLLENESAYANWRKTKLEDYGCLDPARIIEIADAASLSAETLANFATQIQASNFAFFEIDHSKNTLSREGLLGFGRGLGLQQFESSSDQVVDGVTTLKVVDSTDRRSRYIPYSSRALNWHTDGYYNPEATRIGAFLLYCVNPAPQGGDSFLLDHEMIYIQIRDTAPELLIALMDPAVMVVPANVQNGAIIRAEESGPVFSVDSESGRLHMRYSARPQFLTWKPDAPTKRAVELLNELLNDNEYTLSLKLKQGQGMVCNNVLHGRWEFIDGSIGEASRRYYRVRYYDSVHFSGCP